MAGDPSAQPLLSSSGEDQSRFKSSNFAVFLARWGLKLLMWVIFLAWVGIMFILPGELTAILPIFTAMKGTVFGLAGSVFLFMSAPILIIALLGYVYKASFSDENQQTKGRRFARPRLWTFPVLLDGPFGVVSATEFIWIVLFAAFILWGFVASINQAASFTKILSPLKAPYFILEFLGAEVGLMGAICTTFLFLPVARGSILLRLIDIPFEHAARYHVWLGHLTMAVFSLHGVFFIVSWTMQGNLVEKLLEWKSDGVANLAGVISLLAGLLMWVTSFQSVRTRYFELFFYTHQLYVVFIIFFAMHVGDFAFCFVAGAVFLFIVDRFLRFCQSRFTVNVLSTSCLPCGTVKLAFSKPPGLKYNALSFIFVQVKELSWLQWHPFSVSSSPLDGENRMEVLIKVLGGWTEKLRSIIKPDSEEGPYCERRSITASVEGPYGHEVAYHLKYENLILVAGGIGISPFLAVLRDILHRVERKSPCQPRNILVIWAVKKSKELSLLSLADVQNICPSFPSKLSLEVQAYVTQESHPSLEERDFSKDMKVSDSSSLTSSNGGQMSSLVGTANNIWAGAYFVASTAGFIISFGMLQKFYTIPLGVISWWYKGLMFLICMVGSVVIFGGLTILLWSRFERGNTKLGEAEADSEKDSKISGQADEETATPDIVSLTTTHYGRRPDFQAIFDDLSNMLGHVDVGVLVCGPSGLQTTVAKACRKQIISRKRDQPVFHFHSHSFDL
ncbi:ferric reduction oxidase 7, chloroplastic-like [Wolffia australiana]